MTIGAVDYASSYFKYKTPTPIQGTPTNKTLKRLKQELRANASSVESDLGGGDHGYLGLCHSSCSTNLFPLKILKTLINTILNNIKYEQFITLALKLIFEF